MKGVGKKLMGGSEAQAAPAPALTQEVASHGFDTSKIQIDSSGNTVQLAGEVKSQEEAERIILALGNTVGVQQVDTSKLIVTAETPAAKMYTVKKGDTLWKIAGSITARRRLSEDRRGQQSADRQSGPHPARLGPSHSLRAPYTSRRAGASTLLRPDRGERHDLHQPPRPSGRG